MKKTLPSIGFLTVLDQGNDGLFGGYLVLNAAGRPLEFHCTAPVRANRAQQILYGATLAPYLYGEQIGCTLVGKAKTSPLWICTDVEPALAVRDFVETPVALLVGTTGVNGDREETERTQAGESSSSAGHWRVEPAHASAPRPHAAGLVQFEVGRFPLAVAATHGDDRAAVTGGWGDYAELDLHEPFARIREAIEEAQKAAR